MVWRGDTGTKPWTEADHGVRRRSCFCVFTEPPAPSDWRVWWTEQPEARWPLLSGTLQMVFNLKFTEMFTYRPQRCLITYLAMRRTRRWRVYQCLVAWKSAKRCDWCWVTQQSRRSPPAPGRPSAAFPRHPLHRLPLGFSGLRFLCGSRERSPRSFLALEAEGPSIGSSRPVEGGTTARTWTAAREKEQSCLEKENVMKI